MFRPRAEVSRSLWVLPMFPETTYQVILGHCPPAILPGRSPKGRIKQLERPSGLCCQARSADEPQPPPSMGRNSAQRSFVTKVQAGCHAASGRCKDSMITNLGLDSVYFPKCSPLDGPTNLSNGPASRKCT